MADYKRMYTLLCKAIDNVIDPLSRIPDAKIFASYLQNALLQAEEIFISTTPYVAETAEAKIVQMKIDIDET